MTVYFAPRMVEVMEGGRDEIEPIGRRVAFELPDDLLLPRDRLVVVVNIEVPVSCDILLWCSIFLRASSGSPSHLLFTLGTWSGSFCTETLDMLDAVGLAVFAAAAAFLCCSANCSNALVDGSFSVRKPSMPFFFFGLGCGCLPCDEPRLEVVVEVDILPPWLVGREGSLVPRSRVVAECEDGVVGALSLASVDLFRTASLGTRTAAVVVWDDIIEIGETVAIDASLKQH
jgi:hypothetical protein